VPLRRLWQIKKTARKKMGKGKRGKTEKRPRETGDKVTLTVVVCRKVKGGDQSKKGKINKGWPHDPGTKRPAGKQSKLKVKRRGGETKGKTRLDDRRRNQSTKKSTELARTGGSKRKKRKGVGRKSDKGQDPHSTKVPIRKTEKSWW